MRLGLSAGYAGNMKALMAQIAALGSGHGISALQSGSVITLREV